MTFQSLLVEIRNGIGILWMNRPESSNALDETMLTEMTAALAALEEDPDVRIVVLAGTGDCFCTGIGREWIGRMLKRSRERNRADGLNLANLLYRLHHLKKPTVARIQGTVANGGAGLVAACDLAVASYDADFRLDLVRFGLVGTPIAPYLIRAMGERMARHYLLTGETFTAGEAYRTGLVSDIVQPQELDARINELLGHLIQGAPEAQALTKEWIRTAAEAPLTPELAEESASRLAAACVSAECRAGLEALLAKRKQPWLLKGKKKAAGTKAQQKSGTKAQGKSGAKGRGKTVKAAKKSRG
jgi:methylglutaconyl-CoA hydratase